MTKNTKKYYSGIQEHKLHRTEEAGNFPPRLCIWLLWLVPNGRMLQINTLMVNQAYFVLLLLKLPREIAEIVLLECL